MGLLLDNDIVYKLAQMDMLDGAVEALQEGHGAIYVLNTLRYQVNRKRMLKRLGEEAVQRVLAFVDSVSKCEVPASDELLLATEGVKGLDPGELQLLQALIDAPTKSLMLTGDKNFLRALASSQVAELNTERLRERFICFEQIVMLLIDTYGFERVRGAAAYALNQTDGKWDGTMHICFSGRENSQEANVRQGLNSNIRALIAETGSILWTHEGKHPTQEASDTLSCSPSFTDDDIEPQPSPS
ncbi:hypothetical protein [Gallaecimonas sp. GXIMD4217]|uniref:hypothetical protein n=1 Tax=Gallaecimonas sp. GXIMD4217 TaxID=3131927 RepID=UPI00311AF84A